MKIKVKNLMWQHRNAYAFAVPEFLEFTGEATKPKWISDSQLALKVADLDVPVRIFDRRQVVEIDGVTQEFADTVVEPDIERLVQGSKGRQYVITRTQGKWHCTCPGFQFRGGCKHTA